MADVMKQESFEALADTAADTDTAVDRQDSAEVCLDDDDDMMIGKYERPPTRRALTHEEFEALIDFLKQPPKPLTPEAKRMIENYKRFKAQLK